MGLHSVFQGGGWREIRLDIDPDVNPEIVGSLTDLSAVSDCHVDAVWSSHSIEHIFSHQVPVALREFYRVLKPGGFALVTMPDLQAAAEMVAADQLDEIAYVSPAGPIAPIDMIYSYRRLLLDENEFMCHRTGFTARTLYRALRSAGFPVVVVERNDFCLWATAWKAPGAIPQSMAGFGGRVYSPQNDDEILAGCRLWRRGQDGNVADYRSLHELRINAGKERIAPVVLIERAEELSFIPHFADLLNRCQFLARLVILAPFPAPPGWRNNEFQEWLKLPVGANEDVAKVLRGVPADWVGLLKPAAPDYCLPQGVISLTIGEIEAPSDKPVFGVFWLDRGGQDASWRETLISLQQQTRATWKFVALSPSPSPGGIFDSSDDYGWLELENMNDAVTLNKALSALVEIMKMEWFTLVDGGWLFAESELAGCTAALSSQPNALALTQESGRAPWFNAGLASALAEMVDPGLEKILIGLLHKARQAGGDNAIVAVSPIALRSEGGI